MHIWCEYGEHNLDHSGVIMLTRCHDLEDEGQVIHNEYGSCPMMHTWCECGECTLDCSEVIAQTDRQTDRQTEMTTIPFGQKRQGVINQDFSFD